MDYYYTDTALECWQQFQEDNHILQHSKIDALAYRKNEANVRLNDEIAGIVRKERPDWGDHYMLLLGAWKEREPMGNWRQWRRCVMAYELPKASQIKVIAADSSYSIRLPPDGSVTLDLRSIRGIRDTRLLGGVEYMDVLYLVAKT